MVIEKLREVESMSSLNFPVSTIERFCVDAFEKFGFSGTGHKVNEAKEPSNTGAFSEMGCVYDRRVYHTPTNNPLYSAIYYNINCAHGAPLGSAAPPTSTVDMFKYYVPRSNGNVTMIDGSVRTVGYLAVNNSTINNSKMRLWWLDKKY